MTINTDLQRLEPGNRVRLYEVDGSKFDGPLLRFHADTLPHTPEEIAAANGDESKLPAKSIWWQGEEYSAWPVQVEGIEMSSDGQSAQPKLSVANLDGTITALCLAFDDMVQAKVIVHDTFKHYLDAVNFPEGNSDADPEQEKVQVYYIDSKSTETNEIVEFTLPAQQICRGCLFLPGKFTPSAPGACAETTVQVMAAIMPVRCTSTRKAIRQMTQARINALGCWSIAKTIWSR